MFLLVRSGSVSVYASGRTGASATDAAGAVNATAANVIAAATNAAGATTATIAAPASLRPGTWRGAITNESGNTVPFLFQVTLESGKSVIEILNGTERLRVDEITSAGDSIFFKMPFFDSEFRVLLSKDDHLSGLWIRHLVSGQSALPFHAAFGKEDRFPKAAASVMIGGTYKILFPGAATYSVGTFSQNAAGIVTGSILNIDGDYRFLEGRVRGDSLYLSTFDGSHCFLLKAKYYKAGDSLGGGLFYMGKSAVRGWAGIKDAKAALPDAYSITSMKAGAKTLDFKFKDLQGKEVSLTDPRFRNKVIIVQFMGSWCPNCMDETAFLSKFYKKYSSKVAIVGLAYERTTNFETSKRSLSNFVRRFKVEYPILVTGYTNDPKEVLVSMPALKNYVAFPTTIILDRNGNVSKIHTGFSGPGTGKYYQEFEEEFTAMILHLSAEAPAPHQGS